MYQFIRTLNNNAVLAVNKADGGEVILMGKGIGFRPKEEKDGLIGDHQVERAFISLDHQWKAAYLELIETVDEETLSVCSEVILKASESLGDLHPSLFVVLTGHVNFAIRRLKENIVIENPLLYEIQVLYPNEYAVALVAKNLLEKRLHLSICEEEAGYIALHLNAARLNQDVKASLKRTNLIRGMMDLVEKELEISLEGRPMVYRQLLDHLKGVLERLEAGVEIENPLMKEIRRIMPQEYQLAEKLSRELEKHVEHPVGKSEVGYMACHLHRLKAML